MFELAPLHFGADPVLCLSFASFPLSADLEDIVP